MGKQLIGILGGTFNPIHNGHLRLAVELYERLNLAQVLFIPVAQPPHRKAPSVSSNMRLKMVQAAVSETDGLNVDDRELRRSGPSYTVDTLVSLRESYPNNPLGLILGMDTFLSLPTWHEWERLVTLAHLLVVQRPDCSITDQNVIANFLTEYKTFTQNDFMQNVMIDFLAEHRTFTQGDLTNQMVGKVWLTEIPSLTISATQIRSSIATGKNPHYLLPKTVLDIINTQQLYR